METDPSKINDAERQIEATILEVGQAYADSNKRQKKENKSRAENRARIKELGVRTDAYQVAVRICKDLTESERKDFLRDLDLLVRVLGPRQRDFFEDEAIKAEKREQKRRDKEAEAGRTQAELDAKTDTDPKSDPAKGGAGKGRKKKGAQAEPPAGETGDELIARVAREKQAEQEQREGDAILSQSERAAKKREAAGLN